MAGMAGQGSAWRGTARQAWRGSAGPGVARQGRQDIGGAQRSRLGLAGTMEKSSMITIYILLGVVAVIPLLLLACSVAIGVAVLSIAVRERAGRWLR